MHAAPALAHAPVDYASPRDDSLQVLEGRQAPVVLHAGNQLARPYYNPEGSAALGSVVGNLFGHGVASLVSIFVAGKPPSTKVEIELEDMTAEQAQQATVARHNEAVAALRAWNRKRHAITSALATVGSSVGAYMAADPQQAARAAIGAAIGTGGAKAVNVAVNPDVGFPGIVTGALGAYVGARSAR